MHEYLSRLKEPPRLPHHNELLARLRKAKGAEVVTVLAEAGVDVNSVLVEESATARGGWRYDLTTALVEVYLSDDVAAVEALLVAGALITRYVTLPDHSTEGFAHGQVEYRLPRGMWSIDIASRSPRHTGRQLDAAFDREVSAARNGKLAGTPADRARALVCALIRAIDKGDRKVVAHLLAIGADPTLGAPGGNTAIGFALERDELDVLALLLEYPTALEQVCAWKLPNLRPPLEQYPIGPLHAAAVLGNKRAIDLLIARGANPAHGIDDDHRPLRFHVHQMEGKPDRGIARSLAVKPR